MFKSLSKFILGLALAAVLMLSKASLSFAACRPGGTDTDYKFGCVNKGYSCQNLGECSNVAPPPSVGPLNLDKLNQTIFQNKENIVKFSTPRGIISYILPFLFTLAGLVLFVMILWGGFEMLAGAAEPKQQEAGKQRILAGVIGFLVIFASYWLAQLLQTIFGISILG